MSANPSLAALAEAAGGARGRTILTEHREAFVAAHRRDHHASPTPTGT